MPLIDNRIFWAGRRFLAPFFSKIQELLTFCHLNQHISPLPNKKPLVTEPEIDFTSFLLDAAQLLELGDLVKEGCTMIFVG